MISSGFFIVATWMLGRESRVSFDVYPTLKCHAGAATSATLTILFCCLVRSGGVGSLRDLLKHIFENVFAIIQLSERAKPLVDIIDHHRNPISISPSVSPITGLQKRKKRRVSRYRRSHLQLMTDLNIGTAR